MKIKIAVPREAKAGDKIRFQSPIGQTCEVVVPKGLSRGFFTGKRIITVSFMYVSIYAMDLKIICYCRSMLAR